jgi:Rps23 Pro-64 3,4-dihydroxylase Tpa1-like proline 4-hydroxylase
MSDQKGAAVASTSEVAKSATEDARLVVEGLRQRVPGIRSRWNAAEPFHYVVIDDFLPTAMAEAILAAYPVPDVEGWDKTTYTHQKMKFAMCRDFPETVDRFFSLSATPEFLNILSDICGVPKLIADPDLVGGGLHQILRGGFLDVHVDYNFHPVTKLHRRLNVLVYMNKDWKPEYQGYLELWERGQRKRRLENIAPLFNRAVIFETNEVSFHGHPTPLNTPPDKTRKSLALYYYTTERDVVAPEHNTMYHQSTGLHGYVKTAVSSAQAVIERFRDKGPTALVRSIAEKAYRRVRGLPPVNR